MDGAILPLWKLYEVSTDIEVAGSVEAQVDQSLSIEGKDHDEMVNYLVNEKHADLSVQNDQGNVTALIWAAIRNTTKSAKILIDAAVTNDIKSLDIRGKEGQTALMMAAECKSKTHLVPVKSKPNDGMNRWS